MTYDDDAVSLIAARCNEPESGGRMIDAILTNTVLPHLSSVFLQRMLNGEAVSRVHLNTKNEELAYAID